jgi:hypothetical protein
MPHRLSERDEALSWDLAPLDAHTVNRSAALGAFTAGTAINIKRTCVSVGTVKVKGGRNRLLVVLVSREQSPCADAVNLAPCLYAFTPGAAVCIEAARGRPDWDKGSECE